MKQIHILTLTAFFALNIVNLKAQPIWTGTNLIFNKVSNVDWTLPSNQNLLTDNIWITRQNSKPNT